MDDVKPFDGQCNDHRGDDVKDERQDHGLGRTAEFLLLEADRGQPGLAEQWAIPQGAQREGYDCRDGDGQPVNLEQ